MNSTDHSSFESRLGYSFNNQSLLEQALTHRSFSKQHNERLEFLGDSLVNTLIAERLFHAYSDVPEGHLSAMRSSLVRRETLADIAKTLSLGDALLLGGGTLKTGGHRLESILADAYEAVVAAIYLDSNWDSCAKVISQHFDGRLDNLEITEVRDAKSRLQEWLQAKGLNVPEYRSLGVDGPGHAQRFKIQCIIEAELVSKAQIFLGEGSNRRTAEQQAAALALSALEATDTAAAEKE